MQRLNQVLKYIRIAEKDALLKLNEQQLFTLARHHLSPFMQNLLTVSLVSAPYVMMDTGYSGLVSNVRYNNSKSTSKQIDLTSCMGTCGRQLV